MSIIYRRLKLADARPLIAPMLPAQWSKTGDSDLPCEPNWEMYATLERHGALFIVLVFDEEVSIGYAVALVHPHPNSSRELVSTIATYYVEERPGTALIMRSMLAYLCRLVQIHPITRINIRTHARYSIGRILEAMGMEMVEVGYQVKLDRHAEKLTA